MRDPLNDLRMRMKEALDNLWSRISGIFGTVNGRIDDAEGQITGLDNRVDDLEDAVDDLEGDMIKSISLNGVNVPKDAQGNVALRETDPTVPAWAKQPTKPTYTATEVGAIPTTQKGAASGVAELDSSGKVPSSQLPSYVDDVLEYASQSAFPATGEAGKIYVAQDTNLTYRWSGSAYVEISPSLALGETSSTAYRGDRGKAAYDHAQAHGSAYASGLYLIQTNAEGHVIGAVAVQKSDITALGIPGQDTTYTFSDGDPTLAWGARSKVGTTGGTDLHVTMPAMPSAQDVGALPDSTTIPTKTSQLQNDSRFLTQHQDISGKKDVQSAVADPTASGTAVAFIDSITQNANGVITPTKKTVRSASQSESGLMSAADKAKLDGIAAGAQVNSVTGVKGGAESSYRTGNVNLTPANIGALATEIDRATISDLNNTDLVGHAVLTDNPNYTGRGYAANVPPGMTTGYKWYDVYLFGHIQMAIGYSERGAFWVRTWTNNEWTSWQLIGGATITGTVTSGGAGTIVNNNLNRSGNVCTLSAWMNMSATLPGTNGLFGTVPDGFRPSHDRYLAGYVSSLGLMHNFRIKPSGEIVTATTSSTYAASGYIYLFGSYNI